MIGLYLLELDTPFKYGSIKHYNINWPLYSTTLHRLKEAELFKNEARDPATHLLQSLERLKIRCSGNPRRYIQNTINIIANQEFPVTNYDDLDMQKHG